ncbi:MAG: hypothetical protein AAFR58_09555 [Cyanobacteria bacterium J06627_28]
MTELLLTLDTDWAPDFAIDFVADYLVAHQVKATWFVTHASPAIERLRQYSELFELGIHPNFLTNSSHGSTPEAILQRCMELVPEAKSMRTHALVQSTPLLNMVMEKTPIVSDVSLLLPKAPGLQPVSYPCGRGLLRIPYFWEDDIEMEYEQPSWQLAPLLDEDLDKGAKGLKIFDFHPIHIYLNSADMKPYQAMKRLGKGLSEVSLAEAQQFVAIAPGTQTMFKQVTSFLSETSSLRINDLASRYWKG